MSTGAVERFRWFHPAKMVHLQHYDHEVNSMVADHFWDKSFETYADCAANRP